MRRRKTVKRYWINRMVKRLRNCHALNKVINELDNQVYQQFEDLVCALEGPFVILTLVTRGEL